MSHVMCPVYFFFWVELVSGGFVINGAYPVSFIVTQIYEAYNISIFRITAVRSSRNYWIYHHFQMVLVS